MNRLTTEIVNLYNKYSKRYAINVKEDNQKRVLASVYIIFTLVTISILLFFAINPALSTVSNLQHQLDSDRAVEEALHSKLLALENLEVAYENLTPDLPVIFRAVPKQSEIPYLTRQLETIAANTHLTITNLQVNTVELYPADAKNQPLFSYTFNIVVDGTQNGINDFLANLIYFDRMLSIDRIASGKAQTSGNIEASIIGRAYYFND